MIENLNNIKRNLSNDIPLAFLELGHAIKCFLPPLIAGVIFQGMSELVLKKPIEVTKIISCSFYCLKWASVFYSAYRGIKGMTEYEKNLREKKIIHIKTYKEEIEELNKEIIHLRHQLVQKELLEKIKQIN